MSTSRAARPALARILKSSTTSNLPPTFLAPCFQTLSQTSPFSTSSTSSFPKDNNRERGVSTIRRTGPKQALSLSNEPLPVPVLDPARRSKIKVDENHGLWQFFHSKEKPMNTPEEDAAHGRAWAVEELRGKSWEDLHSLWWECCKERNRIATESKERERVEAGYGESEANERDKAVRETQRAIKHTLTERFYSWEDARKIAANDPEVDLSGSGPAYIPQETEEYFDEEDVENYEEEEMVDEAEGEPKQLEEPKKSGLKEEFMAEEPKFKEEDLKEEESKSELKKEAESEIQEETKSELKDESENEVKDESELKEEAESEVKGESKAEESKGRKKRGLLYKQ